MALPGVKIAVAATLFAALLLPAFALAHLAKEEPEQKAGEVGVEERLGNLIPLQVTFRDESGRAVSLAQLVTGPTIVLPVYYRCSNVCSDFQSGLARALPAVRRTPGEDYRVLSVSFDETETPELAARAQKMYLASLGTSFPPSGWRFLTGDKASIRRLTDAAGYNFQRRGHDFMHPLAAFVVSGNGMIVRYLYGTTFLPKDVTLALVEAGEGRVGTTIRKVVGYCFTFDPARKSYQLNLLRVCATVVIACSGGFFLFLVLTGRKKRQHLGGP